MVESETSSEFTCYNIRHDISLKTISCSKFCSNFISSFLYAIMKSKELAGNKLAPLTDFQKCKKYQFYIIIQGFELREKQLIQIIV